MVNHYSNLFFFSFTKKKERDTTSEACLSPAHMSDERSIGTPMADRKQFLGVPGPGSALSPVKTGLVIIDGPVCKQTKPMELCCFHYPGSPAALLASNG